MTVGLLRRLANRSADRRELEARAARATVYVGAGRTRTGVELPLGVVETARPRSRRTDGVDRPTADETGHTNGQEKT